MTDFDDGLSSDRSILMGRPVSKYSVVSWVAQNFLSASMTGDIGVSQTLPKLYTPNGGIYATRRDVLFDQNAIIGKRTKIWQMSRERSLDIDEPIDFLIAEIVGQKLGYKKAYW